MADLIPIFPLQLVVFPTEKLNLHIFEPRYKQLIIEAEESGMQFGIPCFFEKKQLDYGTLVKLVAIKHKYPDGKMDIETVGIRSFRIKETYKTMHNRLYPGGEVELIPLDIKSDPSLNYKISSLIEELYGFMKIEKSPPSLEEGFISYNIAHKIGLSLEQEYELLEIVQEVKRQEFLIKHLESFIPAVQEMENLRKKIQMNGHFKNIIPPNL